MQIHAAHVMTAKGYNFSHSIHHRYQTARLQTRISFHHLSFHSLSLNACVSFSLSRPFQCSILLSLSLQANLLHFILSFCHSVTPGKASSKDIFNLNTKTSFIRALGSPQRQDHVLAGSWKAYPNPIRIHFRRGIFRVIGEGPIVREPGDKNTATYRFEVRLNAERKLFPVDSGMKLHAKPGEVVE